MKNRQTRSDEGKGEKDAIPMGTAVVVVVVEEEWPKLLYPRCYSHKEIPLVLLAPVF